MDQTTTTNQTDEVEELRAAIASQTSHIVNAAFACAAAERAGVERATFNRVFPKLIARIQSECEQKAS